MSGQPVIQPLIQVFVWKKNTYKVEAREGVVAHEVSAIRRKPSALHLRVGQTPPMAGTGCESLVGS